MTPDELLPQVYDELRKLAAAKLASEKPGQTLDATALVHEAFLKLGGERSFATKSDYLKSTAQAVRRITSSTAPRGAKVPPNAEAGDVSISNRIIWSARRRTTLSKPWLTQLAAGPGAFSLPNPSSCISAGLPSLNVPQSSASPHVPRTPGGPTPAPGSPSNSRKTNDSSAHPELLGTLCSLQALGRWWGYVDEMLSDGGLHQRATPATKSSIAVPVVPIFQACRNSNLRQACSVGLFSPGRIQAVASHVSSPWL